LKKVISVVIAMMMVFALFAGCAKKAPVANTSATTTSFSADSKASLTIAWWGNQVRNDATQKVMKMYTTKYPNITLQAEFVDWASYWNKLATEEAANATPDVIQMDYGYIDQYVSNKLLLDLTPYVKSGALDATKISSPVLASGAVNGKDYGISLGTNSLSLVYDPAVLAKAGVSEPKSTWTWADFDTMVEAVYKSTGIKAAPLYYTDGDQWIEYQARAYGYSLYSKDGKSLGFTDTKILTSVYDRLLALTKDGSFVSPDKVVAVTTPEMDPLVGGTAWLTSLWSNQFVALQAAAKRPLKMINLPINSDGKKQALYDKPSMFFSVSASTKYKDAAVNFVDYFENDVVANSVLLAERGVPTSSDVLAAIKPLVPAPTAQIFDYISMIDTNKLTTAIDAPPPAAAAKVLSVSKDCYYKVAYQTETPAQAAADFISQANAALAAS
jgi:multiple sugar transport system substrate-binding protein